jgi:hypothetical protein
MILQQMWTLKLYMRIRGVILITGEVMVAWDQPWDPELLLLCKYIPAMTQHRRILSVPWTNINLKFRQPDLLGPFNPNL